MNFKEQIEHEAAKYVRNIGNYDRMMKNHGGKRKRLKVVRPEALKPTLVSDNVEEPPPCCADYCFDLIGFIPVIFLGLVVVFLLVAGGCRLWAKSTKKEAPTIERECFVDCRRLRAEPADPCKPLLVDDVSQFPVCEFCGQLLDGSEDHECRGCEE